LENTLVDEEIILHPNPKRYKNKDSGFPFCCSIFIGISITLKDKKTVNIADIINQFTETVNQWGQCTQGMFIEIKNVKGLFLKDLEEYQVINHTNEIVEDQEQNNPIEDNNNNEQNNNQPITVITKVDETKESKKLGSAEDVFNKIRWDPKYDTTMFTVGYMDRFVGIIELSFEKFVKNPDPIPFHRIYIFKLNDQVVWDRDKKINLLD